MAAKIGFELELLVLDEQFNETNNADVLIADAQKQGVTVTPECSHAMVEVNSRPDSLLVAASDLVNQLDRLNGIAEYRGLKVLPIEMPLDADFKPIIRNSPRYGVKKRLLGEDRFEISGKVMGFHVHYDLPDDNQDKIDQINFLKAVDPLAIAVTACSPHYSEGMLFDSWRTHTYRYIVHEDLPFQGQLQRFGTSYDRYVQEHLEKYLHFLHLSKEKDVDFSHYADEYNSIWGPTRINPHYGTSEIRSMGAVPDIVLLFGLADLIDGGLRRMRSSTGTDNLYLDVLVGRHSDPEESYSLLQAMSDDAIRYGFKTEGVFDYCSSLAAFCDAGVVAEGKPLASYANRFLADKKNYADKIVSLHSDNHQKYAHLHEAYLDSLRSAHQYFELPVGVIGDGG
ncbi:hypothetical protein GF367_04325 [Candidatus Woesearchaeota archaeon]|nr:hypothetical protein [Candidatus Woesearchaeota archaeon]